MTVASTKIMIVSYAPNLALALASVVNYDRKWRHNLKRRLLMIDVFLIQATKVENRKFSTTFYLILLKYASFVNRKDFGVFFTKLWPWD